MEEQQAIARLQQGDLQGLETLVQLYQLQAIRAAALITADRPLSEDIVQSAFIRAAERISQYDPRQSFGPWFLRSVINDAIKAANRQKRFVGLDAREGDGEAWNLLQDPMPLPEDILEAKETQQKVWQAIQRLPPRQRAAIAMRYYLGMREEEMKLELDSPIGSIKWWLHDARQRLSKILSNSIMVEEQQPTSESTRGRKPGDQS